MTSGLLLRSTPVFASTKAWAWSRSNFGPATIACASARGSTAPPASADPLFVQLGGEQGQALLLGGVELELVCRAIDDALAHLGRIGLAHVPAAVVHAVAAGGEAAEDDGGAEDADEGSFEPAFHGGRFLEMRDEVKGFVDTVILATR